tara:strand:+ start:2245 stop:2397 length:153 start_codon:yes stop_codon:yes gene_type:complete
MAKRRFPFKKNSTPILINPHARKTPDSKIGKTGLVGELMDSPTESNEKTR